MRGYKRVTANEAPVWAVETASSAAREAARILGLGKVKVQWYIRDGSAPAPSAAWVNEDDPARIINLVVESARKSNVYELRALVFHEARHLWQIKTVFCYGDMKKAEDDANQFAYQRTGYTPNIKGHWE